MGEFLNVGVSSFVAQKNTGLKVQIWWGCPSPGAEDLLGLIEVKLIDILLKNLSARVCVEMSKYQ